MLMPSEIGSQAEETSMGKDHRRKNNIFYYNYSYLDIIACGEISWPCWSLVNNIVLPDPDLRVLDQTLLHLLAENRVLIKNLPAVN